ncbi:hypothetical protein CMO89_00955 [Candidatus Woesearchaeota archaeon]|nr:hypothetical protein [Candidatus Woesearchaeota archaeon]|tara:strand:- start:1049 stop:2329 length:1281 start_codon:yes stop_codon:yes gene_type:complete
MKKRNLIYLLFIVLVSIRAFAVVNDGAIDQARLRFSNASNIYQYNVNNTFVNQNPDPAEPGRYVEVRWKVENFGGEKVKDLRVELIPAFPFSLEAGDSPIRKVGTVWGNQMGNEGMMVYYKLRVHKDAIEGDNAIMLRYSNDEGKIWTKLDPFNIRVRTHDAILSILSAVTVPDQIVPGENAELQLKLKNIADSPIKDIRVKLDIADVPFVPIGIANEKNILRLSSGKESLLKFSLTAESDAESKIYKVPLLIDYRDGMGSKYTKNNTIGLIVGEEPKLTVTIDNSEVYTNGDTGDVVIKFVNKGVTDLKFLDVKLKGCSDYKLLSPDNVYVGNIDSDDYETADFNLHIQTAKPEVLLPLSLEYRDANNKEFNEDVNLILDIYSKSEAKKLGLKTGSKGVGIFIVIIIVVAGLVVYRRWKKRKSQS